MACDENGVRWEGRVLGRACAGKGVRWKSVRLEGRSLKRACSENGMRANIASLVFCPQIFLNEITRHLGRIETILTLKSIKCDPKFWHCGNFISEKKNPKRICRSVKLIWCLKNWSCNFSSPELMARAWETPTWRYWNLKKKSFCYKKSFLDFFLFTLIISSRKLPKKEKHDFFHIYCTILLLFCHFWVNLLPSAWLIFSQTNICISQIIDKNFLSRRMK